MFVHEIIPTTLTTKMGPDIIPVPIILGNLSGPQYLRTFDTSYSVLCMSSMAIRTMAPMIITHNVVAPQKLKQYRQRKLIPLPQNVRHV